jgi:hypothetical protein
MPTEFRVKHQGSDKPSKKVVRICSKGAQLRHRPVGRSLRNGLKSALPGLIRSSTARMGLLLQWCDIDYKTVDAVIFGRLT